MNSDFVRLTPVNQTGIDDFNHLRSTLGHHSSSETERFYPHEDQKPAGTFRLCTCVDKLWFRQRRNTNKSGHAAYAARPGHSIACCRTCSEPRTRPGTNAISRANGGADAFTDLIRNGRYAGYCK